MSKCGACSRRWTCKTIRQKIVAIEENKPFDLGFQKTFDSIVIHLKRSGYDYPKVSQSQRCWLAGRPVVVDFYLSQIDNLPPLNR